MTGRGRLVTAIATAGLVVCVAVVGSLIAAVGSGGPPDAVLAALAADPLAARTQPGARLTWAEDRSAKPGGTFAGKPVSTQLLRSFVPDSGDDLAALYLQLTDRAARSGWTMAKVADGSAQGAKSFNFGQGEIGISINHFTSPPCVTVVMTP